MDSEQVQDAIRAKGWAAGWADTVACRTFERIPYRRYVYRAAWCAGYREGAKAALRSK